MYTTKANVIETNSIGSLEVVFKVGIMDLLLSKSQLVATWLILACSSLKTSTIKYLLTKIFLELKETTIITLNNLTQLYDQDLDIDQEHYSQLMIINLQLCLHFLQFFLYNWLPYLK